MNAVGRRRRTRMVVATAIILAGAIFTAPAQESAGYRMERITFGAAAGRASSASYETSVIFGQEGPVGSASFCNSGFVQNSGFWSVAGPSPVPVYLHASRSVSTASDVDLTWSGSSLLFDVYRGLSPGQVGEPSDLLVTTVECAAADSPPAAEIVYYLVLAAPGRRLTQAYRSR